MTNYRKVLKPLIIQAGEIILSCKSKKTKVSKKGGNEIVSQADVESNNYLIKQLTKNYPDIPLYTEEGVKHKSQSNTRWIVDPLDGTTPWVWGNSGFSISVALEKDREIIIGAVYDPVMKEFFYAEKGKGAFRNNQSIFPEKNVPIKKMFMVVDWGNKKEERKEGLSYFKHFFLPEMFARRVVPQFAPALGLCRIAEGKIHALICNITYVEDHSAGALILQEAGGYCTNFRHNKGFNHRELGIIATNEIPTHKKIVELLRKAGIAI